ADLVRFAPPVPQAQLVDWYRAATLAVVPTHSESFGLVAAEAQACGTPVVAAAVGGLRTAVADGRSGVLVEGHHPWAWSYAIGDLLRDPGRLKELSEGALLQASRFGCESTVDAMLEVYLGALDDHRARLVRSAQV